MTRLKKGFIIGLIWITLSVIGLEIGLRLFAPHLPARFNSAVQYVLQDERYHSWT